MKFYVDFDDCLCETARAFTGIADRLFGIRIPYEEVRFFNLQDSFALTDAQYEALMVEGHRPEVLLSYEETPGASRVVNEWIDAGHEVFIITGRPYSAADASKKWLDEHGLGRAGLYFLNKYGRDTFYGNAGSNLELEDFYRMEFDVAVEDSPLAFPYLEHFPDLRVMVYDRPWNSGKLPGANYYRCADWDRIRELA